MHNDMATLFGFLNLYGYQKCQEYHYYEESYNYRELQNFFLSYYKKMIDEDVWEKIDIIPSGWHKYNKNDVDSSNNRSTIQNIMKKWVAWEEDTKNLLQASYKQLYQLGEINAALKIAELIKDVCEELNWANQKLINFEITNYDLVAIVDEQQYFYKKYNKKIKQIYKDG